MRIAVVHSFYSEAAPSGENIAVRLQAESLARAGHEVDLVGVSSDELAAAIRGYQVRSALNVALGCGLRDPLERLRRFRPDVVHTHNLFPNFGDRWVARWPGPLVATLHNFRRVCASGLLARDGRDCFECPEAGNPLPGLRHACYRQSRAATLPLSVSMVGGIERDRLLRRADRWCFLSERSLAGFQRAGLRESEKVTILPNFVEETVGGGTAARGKRGAPEASWAFVGRLSDQKGILPLLRDWPTDRALTVYGDGPLRSQVEALGSDRVLYRGSVAREEILRALPDHAGLVFPSMSSEGLPTVYLEALAAGLPVVARAGNSAADDVAAFGTGVVFEDFRQVPAAVASASVRWQELSTNARRRFESGYSESAWLRGVEAVYERALLARGAAGAGGCP